MTQKKNTPEGDKGAVREVATAIDILRVDQGTVDLCVLGDRLLCNRVSMKSMKALLQPSKKSSVEKETTLKHDPIEEFRSSPYRLLEDDAPTLIAGLSTWFKQAMCAAALDIPGAKKAQIGRLTWVNGERVPIFGVPQLSMMVVRSADMNRTPDIRTRAILPQWACRLSVRYTKPLIRDAAVANLIGAAGMFIGVGDYRHGKGAGNYGSFEIVAPDDPRYLAVMKAGGRQAQIAAMQSPAYYDDETATLMEWFEEERERRAQRGTADRKKKGDADGDRQDHA